MLRKSRRLHGYLRLRKHGNQACSIESRRTRKTAQIHKRWKQVHQLGKRFCARATGFSSRRRDHARDPRIQFKVGCFSPERMFAQVISVIAQKHDGRALRNPRSVQRLEHLADLRVEVGHVCEVTMPHLGRLRIWKILRRHSFPKDLGAFVESNFGSLFRTRTVEGLKVPAFVEVPVLLRSPERRVRLPETDCQKEGSALHLPQNPHRLGRDTPVIVGFIGQIQSLADRTGPITQLGEHGLARGQLAFHLRRIVTMVGVVQKLWRAPGTRIAFFGGVPVVENLTHAAGRVPVLLEPQRQSGHIGIHLAEMQTIVPHLQCVGTPAREHR